jgi:hypothetical protein
MKRLLFSLPIFTTMALSACSSTDRPDHAYRLTQQGWVDVTPPSRTQVAFAAANNVLQGLTQGLGNAATAYGERAREQEYEQPLSPTSEQMQQQFDSLQQRFQLDRIESNDQWHVVPDPSARLHSAGNRRERRR